MIPIRKSKGKIIVFGIYFWYPLAGVTYQFLHYLIGLRKLGYDPYYIEDSGRWVYDPKLSDINPDATSNIDAVGPILDRHGFAGKWGFRGAYEGGRCYGMSEAEILALYAEADAFLNVCGAQELREEHLRCRRRIYVETDPVAAQVKLHHGDAETIRTLDLHDTHFSFGENFGSPDCRVPLGRYRWLPTRQPVVLELWNRTSDRGGEAYNTIATWKNKGKDIVLDGESYYWSKDREFLKFLELPKRRPGVGFELASGVADDIRSLLDENGWRITNPVSVSQDPESYHRYILESRGEFTVAKDQNIRLRSGWFSDRSACYLAAGRPVINQETGFSNVLPTGRGLFSFTTMDDLLGAVDAIESDYDGHCAAAKELARQYFDATRVLGSLMERAGL